LRECLGKKRNARAARTLVSYSRKYAIRVDLVEQDLGDGS